MALFGCTFKTPGCNRAPEAFKDTVSRGSRFKAAAFLVLRDSGQAFVLQELESSITDKAAKERVMKQLVPGGTIGTKFPEKLTPQARLMGAMLQRLRTSRQRAVRGYKKSPGPRGGRRDRR